jgi:hypothetical protein
MRQFAVGNLERAAATKHYVDSLYRSHLDANWKRPVKYISIPMELSQREVHQMINSDSTEEPEPSLHSSASPTSSSKSNCRKKLHKSRILKNSFSWSTQDWRPRWARTTAGTTTSSSPPTVGRNKHRWYPRRRRWTN